MAVRPILIYGDPRLHEKAEPVKEINDEIREIIDNMYETMYEGKGIGLSATQLGIKKSIFVIDLSEQDKSVSMLEMINPEIIDRKGECSFEEGCLSVPGVTADVDRSEEITVRFMNREEEWEEMSCGGLLARVIQHEYDHLQGILFVQRLKTSIRRKWMSQLRKLAKGVEV